MKRFFSIVMLCAIIAGLFLGINTEIVASAAPKKRLLIYNWGDYMDKSILADFVDYYRDTTGNEIDIRDIKYTTFETNEEMLTKIMLGNDEVDLICPSEYAIERLVRSNKLKRLDRTKIPNINNTDQKIYNKVDSVFDDIVVDGESELLSDYFVPYMWGTLGILYNTDVVKQKDIDAGWGILWNKGENKKLDRKIYVKDSVRDTYAAAVLYLKEYDLLPDPYKDMSIQELINTIDDKLLLLVEDALVDQIPVLKGYEVDHGQADMMDKRPKAYVNLAWSGDALWAIENGSVPLDYYIPSVGGNVWFDGWVIPKNAPNTDVAYVFLDFLCRPDIAMRNSMDIGYTNGLDKEVLRLDSQVKTILEENDYDVDEYFDNQLRYPDIDDESLGVMKDFGNMHEKAMEMWERVKVKWDRIWILIIIVVGVLAVGGGILAFVLIKNNKGKRRRVKVDDTE